MPYYRRYAGGVGRWPRKKKKIKYDKTGKLLNPSNFLKLSDSELLKQKKLYEKEMKDLDLLFNVEKGNKIRKEFNSLISETKDEREKLAVEYRKVLNINNYYSDITYYKKTSLWDSIFSKEQVYKVTKFFLKKEFEPSGDKLINLLSSYIKKIDRIKKGSNYFKTNALAVNYKLSISGNSDKDSSSRPNGIEYDIYGWPVATNNEHFLGLVDERDSKGLSISDHLNRRGTTPYPRPHHLFDKECEKTSKEEYENEPEDKYNHFIFNQSNFMKEHNQFVGGSNFFTTTEAALSEASRSHEAYPYYEKEKKNYLETFWYFAPSPINEWIKYKKILIEFNERMLRKIELVERARFKVKEKVQNVGWVYAMSNKDLPPDTYKIGSTYGIPEERAEELTGTGHLNPFKIVCKTKIQSAEHYEKTIHKILKEYRIRKDREFFTLEVSKIKDCFKQVSILSDGGKKKVDFKTFKNKIKI